MKNMHEKMSNTQKKCNKNLYKLIKILNSTKIFYVVINLQSAIN